MIKNQHPCLNFKIKYGIIISSNILKNKPKMKNRGQTNKQTNKQTNNEEKISES